MVQFKVGSKRKSLVLGVLFFLLAIFAIFSAWRLSSIRNQRLAEERKAGSDKGISSDPTRITRELGILESYYLDNNIPLPEDYEGYTEGVRGIFKLQPEVIKREVAWRSGGNIFVFSPEGKNDTADLAKEKIEEYRLQAIDGNDISDLILATTNDPDIKLLNEPLTSPASKPPPYLLSKIFNMHTQDNNVLFSSSEANQDMFNLGEGDVSQVYSDNFGYTFFVITETGEGKFDTYDSWLKTVSSGQLESSAVDISGLINNEQ